jgi:hypothetical protein
MPRVRCAYLLGAGGAAPVSFVVRRGHITNMKNVLLSSPETDAKSFRAMLVLEALVVATMVGYISPTPLENFAGRALNSSVSFGLAVVAWTSFRLFDPPRYSKNWMFARLAGIAFLWLLLFGAVVAWVEYNHVVFIDSLEKVLSLVSQPVRPNVGRQVVQLTFACRSRFAAFGSNVHESQ